MKNQAKVSRGFDLIAPVYDFAKRLFFGSAPDRAASYWLNELPSQGEILIVGGGTGDLLLPLFAAHPEARVCYLDLSERMINKARNRVSTSIPKHTEQITFIKGTVQDLPDDYQCNVVITPFVLDSLTDPDLIETTTWIRSSIISGGHWLWADFTLSKSRARLVSKVIISALYLFFRLVCGLERSRLPNWEKLFSDLDLQLIKERKFSGGMISSRLYRKP